MAAYREIIDKYKAKILNRENVVGIAYGRKEKAGRKTGEEALIILVEKKLPPKKINKKDLIPQRLGSFQTDVIEIGKLHFFQERTRRLRPAQPGISIGHYQVSAGTFGALVRDRETGKPLILSNNHVLANISNGHDNRAQKDDPILQPGAYDSGKNPADVIAYLERFVPLYPGEGEAECKIALAVEKMANFFVHLLRPDYNFKLLKEGRTNLVDCAVARPVSDQAISPEILGIGQVKGIAEPEVDMAVQKSGRTTGVTRGKIIAVAATVNVSMNEYETATFEDQFITTPMSEAGDSGSLVLNMDNAAVGLLFAGSGKATICNRIKNVMEALSIKF
ncbi:MAG TPA: hypothetical protein GXZ20_08670 [Halanaerobiaceae bacterium]|mgnify:CR=1 FL=1|nr:hypothetical protein [Bacillota bacterium]HHU93188.1 hypothetical protein [Halanaerobiaceae bacterium]HOA40033.1 hypothetical protein [Halanaerobiales bacterium]HPZ62109.1 hypothetical protein [Halanaerobiales bacterium]HQD03394.1 hypothetical protein [Halanaerobiales bacterium]